MQNRNLKKEKTCILAYIQICFHTYSQIHLYQLTKSCVNYKNVVVVKKSKEKKNKKFASNLDLKLVFILM